VGPGYGVIVLDDCNFHESVNVDAFESQRLITFAPPEGEFTVMNYRATGEYALPFRVFPFLEDVGKSRLDLLVRVRADLPQQYAATNMIVRIPVPKSATRSAADPAASARSIHPPDSRAAGRSVSHEFTPGARGQLFEYVQSENTVLWRLERMQGGTEETLRVKVPATGPARPCRRRSRPPLTRVADDRAGRRVDCYPQRDWLCQVRASLCISRHRVTRPDAVLPWGGGSSVNFEIANYNCTGLQIKSLKVYERGRTVTPSRWVRYIAYSNSYVCRV
jgi:AP-4 complex subunit mu-1